MEVLAIALILLVVAFAAIAIFGTLGRTDDSTTELDAEEGGEGPTGTPYPSGSRPAGPGAEGMAVPEAGQISPGPVPDEEDRQPD